MTELAQWQPGSTRQDDWNYAKALAQATDQLPRKFQGNPGNVLVAMEYARSLNLPLMQGITGVQVIDGVPSLSALTMQALVRRAGHRLRLGGDAKAAWCEIVRADDLEFTYRCDFTLSDAEQAGLIKIKPDGSIYSRTRNDKPTPWESHPRAMLRARAISECARMACADVLAGVAYLPGELDPAAEIIDAVDDRPSRATAPLPEPPGPNGQGMPDSGPTDHTGRPESVPEPSPGRERKVDRDYEPLSREAMNVQRWRREWQAELSEATDRLDLAAIRELGNRATAGNQPECAAQARGAWARVQVTLAELQGQQPDTIDAEPEQ